MTTLTLAVLCLALGQDPIDSESASEVSQPSRTQSVTPRGRQDRSVVEFGSDTAPIDQAAPTDETAPTGDATGSGGTSPADDQPTDGSDQRAAARLIAEALAPPPYDALQGDPILLVEALASASDRQQQIQIVHAYWDLSTAVANYYLRLALLHAIDSFDPSQAAADAGAAAPAANDPDSTQGSPAWRALRASVSAQVQDAQLAAVNSQQTLADLLHLPADRGLVLPRDLPHCGPYHTRFESIFSGRAAPARATYLDRLLKFERRAVELRAEAVDAADNALEASIDSYNAGHEPLDHVLSAISLWSEQQLKLIAAVQRYNHHIADYALLVAGLGTPENELVAMLIKPQGNEEPVSRLPIPNGQPAETRAPAETPSAPRDAGRRRTPASTPNVPRQSDRRDQPFRPSSFHQTQRVKQQNAPQRDDPAASSAEQYASLAGISAVRQAQRLAIELNDERSIPPDANTRFSLLECCDRAPSNREQAIAAYWAARQALAGRQVLQWQFEQLETLSTSLKAAETQNGASRELLELMPALLAAEAAWVEADARRIEALYELSEQVGFAPDGSWLVPITCPHGGGYALRDETQPRWLVDSRPLRSLKVRVPSLHEVLVRQSTATIASDAERAAAVQDFEAGHASVNALVKGIAKQTDATLTFLDTLTRYNVAIADYAMAVLPPQTSTRQLVAALVVVQ